MSEQRVAQLMSALDSAPAEPDPAFVSRLARRIRYEATEDADSSIAAIDENMEEPIMIDLEMDVTEQHASSRSPGRWSSAEVMRWAAALVLLAGIAVAVIVAIQDDDPTSVASDGPRAAVDRYFEAFNAGEADAVLSLLTSDAVLTERFGAVGDFFEFDRGDWEDEIVGFTSQGARLTPHACTETVDPAAEVTLFTCTYGFRDAPTLAVGAPSIPVSTLFAVTASGRINAIQVNYDPDESITDEGFVHVGRRFGRWLNANHPDFVDLAISDEFFGGRNQPALKPDRMCCESMSPTEIGELKLEYAQLWAVHLEENDCTYLDGC
ncbi:MAG: hypothetical protein ACR2P0_08760 [Acidimicrobiales bacterium]